jgi:hypothetical protein
MLLFTVKCISLSAQQPNWSTTFCPVSTTAYSSPAQPAARGQRARGDIWNERQLTALSLTKARKTPNKF